MRLGHFTEGWYAFSLAIARLVETRKAIDQNGNIASTRFDVAAIWIVAVSPPIQACKQSCHGESPTKRTLVCLSGGT